MTRDQVQPRHFPILSAFRRRTRPRALRRLAFEPLEARALLTTFNLGTNSTAALISDINQANANGQANTINLEPNATYDFYLSYDYPVGTVNDGLPPIESNLTINGNGAVVERDSIAISNFRLIEVDGAQVSINNLTLEDGSSTGNDQGAGIAEYGANVTLTNVNVLGNTVTGSAGGTAKGGGLAAQGGQLVLNNVNVSGNVAQGGPSSNAQGGGLYASSATVVIEGGTTFSQNEALGGAGANGTSGTHGQNGDSTSPAGWHGGNGGPGAPGGAAQGGAIYVASGQLTMTGATIANNLAMGGAGGTGGVGGTAGNGIDKGTNCIGGTGGNGGAGGGGGFGAGGGLYQPTGVADISMSTFSADVARGGDGGPGGWGGLGGAGANTWLGYFGGEGGKGGNGGNGGNAADGDGGAIDEYGGKLYLVNSTIADNSARGGVAGFLGLPGDDGPGWLPVNPPEGKAGNEGQAGSAWGGGLEAQTGTVVLTDATVAYNDTFAGWNGATKGKVVRGGGTVDPAWGHAEGAGIYVTASVTLDNSLVAYNVDDTKQTGDLGVVSTLDSTNPDNVNGKLMTTSSHNLFGVGGSGALVAGVNGNLVVSSDFFLNLGALGNNGGPTQTVALLPSSPAIGAGSPALNFDPLTGQTLSTDQRGPGYVRSVDKIIDIGAYQATQPLVTVFSLTQSPLVVDNSNDGHTGQYEETLTLTNTGTTNASGGYLVVLAGLPPGVGLAGASIATVGSTASGLPDLQFSISAATPLEPWESVFITIWYSDPGNVTFTQPTPKVYQLA